MNGDAALRAWYHQILDPHVCKRAAGHHPIVSAPAAITIKIFRLNSSGHQILTGRRSRLDGAGRRNMIGRYRVAENSQSARAEDILDLPHLHREILEKGRLVNVVALFVPLIDFAGARLDFVPLGILIGEIAIQAAENLRLERRLHRVAHFFQTRPEISQKSFLAVFIFPDRLVCKIDIHAPGQRERDDQRGGHEKVRFDVLMYTRFEISISRED